MMSRLAVAALALVLQTGAAAPPAAAAGGTQRHHRGARIFEVCRHGCRYRSIQKAVDAAGSFQLRSRRARGVVAIGPGVYRERVLVDGRLRHKRFDRLTIEGAGGGRRETILDGRGARGKPSAGQSGIEAVAVDGIVLRDIRARDYGSDGFSVHGDEAAGGHCDGFRMEGLVASRNAGHGIFAKRCRGGRIADSLAFRDGDSGFSVAETPCDRGDWTNHGTSPAACQSEPRWTRLKNDRGYESPVGFSGVNSKYVKIADSAFYDNGAGIVLGTLDAERFEPAGWSVVERDAVFWNNYDFFLAGARLPGPPPALGQLGGSPFEYPTGVGIVLYGAAEAIVRGNDVFGNYKWGIASFSAPGEAPLVNEGDDGKSIDNQVIENTMGREGADPNGEFDFWNDNTGGGNCWGGNSPDASFAPGNGTVPVRQIYPPCPQAQVFADQVTSADPSGGLQVNGADPRDPKTIVGYATSSPPQAQECSWARHVHPPFQLFQPVEAAPLPGENACG